MFRPSSVWMYLWCLVRSFIIFPVIILFRTRCFEAVVRYLWPLPISRKDTTLPSTRNMVFELYKLSDDLGKGLGPAIVRTLIPKMGLEHASSSTLTMWMICRILNLVIMITDEQNEHHARSFTFVLLHSIPLRHIFARARCAS